MSPDVNSTEEYREWTVEDLTFLVLYCCSSVLGIAANSFVLIGIFGQSLRPKNVLILSLCTSDLMVCTISMPLSASVTLKHIWTMGVFFCKAAFFFQCGICYPYPPSLLCHKVEHHFHNLQIHFQASFPPGAENIRIISLPVAASTTSLMMLALDRYATVKHSRVLSKIRPRKMVMTVWASATFITSPILYARNVRLQACRELWPSDQMRAAFALSHIAVVYLIPCFTVASCHFSVGHKLCASSQPPLPLPIPLLRKPEHVIVVASVLPDGPSKVGGYGGTVDESSSDDATDKKKRGKVRIFSESETGKPDGRTDRKKPPLLKQMSRQSLHGRRRLANMLVAMVIAFAICWAPYVVIRICSEAGIRVSASLLPFCLLLGHTHSAINPLVYYLSNRQSLNLSQGCGFNWPCDKNYPSKAGRPPPSSTNEAALGVFHPCYTKKRFNPRGGRTSDFL